ncbi:hypothetical protein [Streptomyces sp. NBC_00091]|uniref:hypothetical protein n=1 Tax=Streptomyces sp. NBC_00091 TaxID=2975648 RepID=UPI00225B079F|nr:hypothetical protein [Streptomyces sp. NBC_00091]MCX5379962.1 hypothetical protein [Streptomyces sp. NBC_00091]
MTVPVGGPPLSLAATLTRIRALAQERRLDVDEILDAESLAGRTGVPVEVTAALLRGEEFADPTPEEAEETLRRRAAFLYAVSRDTHGQPYAIAEIAAAIGVDPWWVGALVSGREPPHLRHCTEFAAFFGREITFLTDTPAQAVNRALWPAVESLNYGSGDLMADLMNQYGLVSISTRGRALTRTQETLLLGMITGMLSSEVAR